MDTIAKFSHPEITAKGEERAQVDLRQLETLWFNTGTLCNLTCANCYIESSPKNDRLVYLTAAEVAQYLDEVGGEQLGTQQIGFTGGEPFMNPEFLAMIEDCLQRGFETLVLTNAMRPMMKQATPLLKLLQQYGQQLEIRVSLDHYRREEHQQERGPRSWQPTIDGLKWLSQHGFHLSAAGRTYWGETDQQMRDGYRELFAAEQIVIDVDDPARLMLFPEMDEAAEVPEITTACWKILDKSPDDMMCAWTRMIVKRKGAENPAVLACTLLPYDEQFELGQTLAESFRPVRLNHPHCAKFCVLGGGSCSAKD